MHTPVYLYQRRRSLSGRRSLINSCNSLENSLDRLKLTLGLPTETAINIDLRELESLTLRDEMEVAGELVRRARERVRELLMKPRVDREDVVDYVASFRPAHATDEYLSMFALD